jgi:hypothetical protein
LAFDNTIEISTMFITAYLIMPYVKAFFQNNNLLKIMTWVQYFQDTQVNRNGPPAGKKHKN